MSPAGGETFTLEFVDDKAEICILDGMCDEIDLLAERICENLKAVPPSEPR